MKAGDILKIDISKMTEAERLYYNELVAKYNPYHDSKGKFSDRPGSSHYSLPKNNPRLLPKENPPLGVTVHRTSEGGNRVKGTSINGMPDIEEPKPKKPRAPRKPKEKPAEEKPKEHSDGPKDYSPEEFKKVQAAVLDKRRNMSPEEQADAFIEGTLSPVKFNQIKIKNAVEAKTAFNEIGFANVSDKAAKINKDYLSETHHTLTSLMTDFPELKSTFANGLQLEKEGRKGVYASAHQYQLNIGGHSTQNSKLNESYKNDLNAQFHPPGTTYRAVVAHEVGHILHRQTDVLNGNRTYQNDHVTNKIVSKVKGTGGGDAEISKYAAKNTKETIAESFGEVWELRGNARPKAKEYVKEAIIEFVKASGVHKGGTEKTGLPYC